MASPTITIRQVKIHREMAGCQPSKVPTHAGSLFAILPLDPRNEVSLWGTSGNRRAPKASGS
jgi:hypothetical protein